MEITLPGSILFCAASETMQCTADCVWIIELYFLMVLSTTPPYPPFSPSMFIFFFSRWVDAQWALDHWQGTLHTSSCEEQRVHRAERRLCRGESFPLRKRLRANDSEGRIADRSHSDGVRDLLLAQAE